MLDLSPRQQAIIACLSRGPHTIAELTAACGYEPTDAKGRNYVSLMLGRLQRNRGYVIANYRKAGSRRGGYYVLVSRPKDGPGEGPRLCLSCGCRIARDHREDPYCSPCQRRYVSQELDWLAPPTLPFETVNV